MIPMAVRICGLKKSSWLQQMRHLQTSKSILQAPMKGMYTRLRSLWPVSFQRETESQLVHMQPCPVKTLVSCTSLNQSFMKHFCMGGKVFSLGTKSSCMCSRRTIMEDRNTTAVTVWSDLVQIKSSPLPALVLGLSGLIPFISAPVYLVMSHAYLPSIAFAQTAYGAAILSFLGGVRWGFTLPEDSPWKPDWRNLTYSILPSLIGWGGILCPDPISILTVTGGLAGLAYFDTTMYGYPPWFKGLRFLLSIFAVLSLWTTFICRFLLDSHQPQKNEAQS